LILKKLNAGFRLNTSQHAAALRYPIRLKVVFKYFGKLNIVLAVLVLVPLGVSISFADYGIGLRYGIIAAGLFAMGFGLSRLPGTKRIQTNEAMSLTALAFLFAPLLMAYPMMGSGLPFLDALFEAISAVTTTGLSTTATVSGKPQTFLFARAWMQWYGGLGIVVLALAIMIEPGVAARRLGNMGEYDDDLIGATRSHVRYILLVYGLLTAMGICLLLALESSGWNAVLYTFAAVSTGGFAPQDASLSALQSFPQQAAVIFLSMAGAISFIFYRRQIRENWRLMFHDRQTQFFLLAALFSALLLVLLLHFQSEFSWPVALRHGILNAFSAQSTAGFSSMDFSRLDGGSKLVMILSMLSGGCVGSTAGGIKILRLMVMARLIYLMILKAGLSKNASKGIKLTGKKLENDEIQNTLSIILLFVVFTVLSWFPFVAMGFDPLNSLFEVVSAIGTVGLSTGISAPDLHPLLKLILCADMLLGRLEILVWLVLLTPRNWIGKRWEE
jgi:trk system potassium uptake protein